MKVTHASFVELKSTKVTLQLSATELWQLICAVIVRIYALISILQVMASKKTSYIAHNKIQHG